MHLASSGLFKKIFVCVELSQQLNLILKGLVKVASNLVSVSWFDEIAIELLVIIQSIVTIGSKEDGLLIRYVQVNKYSQKHRKSDAFNVRALLTFRRVFLIQRIYSSVVERWIAGP